MATRLPFKDGVFDVVISTDLLGHLPAEEKERLIQETQRVLKPGGHTLHVAEVDNNNGMFRYAKKSPDNYFRNFIVKISGHFGLENTVDLRQRFERAGFKMVKESLIYDLILDPTVFLRLWDEGYPDKSPLIRALVRLARLVSRNKWLKLAVEIMLEGIARVYETLFRRVENAQDIGLWYRKK